MNLHDWLDMLDERYSWGALNTSNILAFIDYQQQTCGLNWLK